MAAEQPVPGAESKAPPPRTPRYNLEVIARLRRRLDEDVLGDSYGVVFAGADYDALVDKVMTVMPTTVKRPVVWDSLRDVAGVQLLAPVARELVWRLAGNIDRLRKGIPVPRWAGQVEAEWVPLQVMSVRLSVQKRTLTSGKVVKKPGGWMRFRVLAGYPAGLEVVKFVSTALASRMSPTLGFARWDREKFQWSQVPSDKRPFRDIRDFGRLRLYGLVSPETCKDGLSFTDIRCPPGAKSWNQALLKKRKRVGFSCPFNYTHDCCVCPVGWTACPAACHAFTFLSKICSICKKQAWHDPQVTEAHCVGCQLAQEG